MSDPSTQSSSRAAVSAVPAQARPRVKLHVPVLGFCAARVMLSLLGAGFWAAGLVPVTADATLRPYFGLTPTTDGAAGALLGVWQRFDAIHYLRIAAHGYSAPDLSAFFPLYPLLTRVAAVPLGGDQLLAALLVSNVAAALALIVFFQLTRDEGCAAQGRRATLYLLFFPTAFFLLVPYTESLALLCSLLAFRFARQGRWWGAGAAALAGALTRIQGILVVPALLVEAAIQLKGGAQIKLSALSAVLAPVGGFLAFLLWRELMGFPSLTIVQRVYWQREAALPLSPMAATLGRMLAGETSFIELVNVAVVVLMMCLAVLALKRLPPTYAVYLWLGLLFNLTQVRVPEPLSAQARYALALFPAFMVLGQLGASSRANRAISYAFFGGWIYLAGQFILWGWVG